MCGEISKGAGRELLGDGLAQTTVKVSIASWPLKTAKNSRSVVATSGSMRTIRFQNAAASRRIIATATSPSTARPTTTSPGTSSRTIVRWSEPLVSKGSSPTDAPGRIARPRWSPAKATTSRIAMGPEGVQGSARVRRRVPSSVDLRLRRRFRFEMCSPSQCDRCRMRGPRRRRTAVLRWRRRR